MTPDTQSETPLVERLRANVTANHRPKPWPSELLRQAADTLTAQAQEIAELREKVERLSLAAIKARQALAHATQFGPVYDTAYNDLDRAIEGAKR